jgi:predicted membrane protein
MEKKNIVSGRRFFLGFILLLIGLVMILERSNIISWEIYDFLMSWKMLIVAIGAYVFISGNRGAGIVVMGIGAILLTPDIFPDYRRIKQFFWPSLFLLVGIAIIFSDKRPKRRNKEYYSKFGEEPLNVNNDFFDESIIFGGREINMATPNLVGGRSTAIFGGMEIDLRQCQISPQGCTIEFTTIFGGNVMKVPNDWTILNKVTTIFGGYSDLRIKDPSYGPNPAKTIVITGVCIFGGTEVRNYDKFH